MSNLDIRGRKIQLFVFDRFQFFLSFTTLPLVFYMHIVLYCQSVYCHCDTLRQYDGVRWTNRSNKRVGICRCCGNKTNKTFLPVFTNSRKNVVQARRCDCAHLPTWRGKAGFGQVTDNTDGKNMNGSRDEFKNGPGNAFNDARGRIRAYISITHRSMGCLCIIIIIIVVRIKVTYFIP